MRLIIAPDRAKTIDNIRKAATEGNLNYDVEPGDAHLTDEQRDAVIDSYLHRSEQPLFSLHHWTARRMTDTISHFSGSGIELVGWEKLRGLTGGAIVTSNHFNPFDNIVPRRLASKLGKGHLNIVSVPLNFTHPGSLGFIVRNGDVVPINCGHEYMRDHFEPTLRRIFDRGEWLLIYPEQSMWFNYRKPRPCKRGAYLYAARFGVPVISCFVEMVNEPDCQEPYFHKVRCRLHVLDTIFPDPRLSEKENSTAMCARDYAQKVRCYEQCYGRQLDYAFSLDDIAGWEPSSADKDLSDELKQMVKRYEAEKSFHYTPTKSI